MRGTRIKASRLPASASWRASAIASRRLGEWLSGSAQGNSLRHGSILSGVGASGKPGAVQFVFVHGLKTSSGVAPRVGTAALAGVRTVHSATKGAKELIGQTKQYRKGDFACAPHRSQFPVAPEYRSNSMVEKEIDGRASDH